MFELMKHLWPQFDEMLSANPSGISAWFWCVTFLFFAVSVACIFINFLKFKTRTKNLNLLLLGQSTTDLALHRRDTMQKARGFSGNGVFTLWKAFDDSLVTSVDSTKLFATVDAEYFFNAKTLAKGLSESRLLAAAPSFLVALGVLGTFVGLTVGLQGLTGTTSEVDALKSGINTLISGAAVAFMTSVWGVVFSLLLNLAEKFFEHYALNKITGIQNKIDSLYPRQSVEQALINIVESSKESKQALQELHERIGDRLQETVNSMSEAMQTALADTLNNVLGSAIQTLVNSSQQQSSQALDGLVRNFMDGMTSAGREQGQLMQQASADVNSAVASMSEQLQRFSVSTEARQTQIESQFSGMLDKFTQQVGQQNAQADQREKVRQDNFQEKLLEVKEDQQLLISTIADAVHASQEQSAKMAAQHQQLLQNLEKVTESAAQSSKHMDSSANQLGMLSANVHAAAELLGQRLVQVTQGIDQTGNQNVELMEQIKRQADTLMGLQSTLLDGAIHLEKAASESRNGFGSLQQSQQQFLTGVNVAVTSMSEQLQRFSASTDERHTQMESQFNGMLDKFTQQVGQQNTQADQREQVRQDNFQEKLLEVKEDQQLLISTIADAVHASQEQSAKMAEQHQQLLRHLEKVTESAAQSSKHMDSSANQLGMLSTNVHAAAELLGQRLVQVTQGIEQTGNKNAALMDQIQKQADTLMGLQSTLLDGAIHLEKAASEARSGFGSLQQSQQQFLNGVKTEFTSLGEALRSQVSAIEKQAEEWLQSYAKEVNTQVDDRMNKWNDVSLSYANQMLHNVQAMNNILDELEVR
ncbi:MAG: anti-phage ZorAB system protein ZorA [Plesiomonas shigelloides]